MATGDPAEQAERLARALENREYVRRLLAERQPAFAAWLEAAVADHYLRAAV